MGDIGSGGIVEIHIPPGGTAGQALVKIDSVDYNATWGAGGGGGGGIGTLSDTAGNNATGPGVVFGTTPTVTFGIVGNTITAIANVTAAPSPVNVTGANGSSVNAQTIQFGNSNGMTLGVSTAANGATITGSYTVPSVPAQTQFVLSNSNGLSFGTVGSTVTASYTVPSTAGLISNINVSAGTTSANLSAMTFSNGNGVSFGLQAGTITGSVAAQSVQTQNSVQVLGSSGNISFANANGVTFGGNASTVTASVAAQSVQTQSTVAINGSTGAISFANGNNVSFGFNASTVTASASFPAQTAYVFSDGNGVSFGTAGSTVTATVATNYMASNQSSNFAATGFTTTTIAGAVIAGTHDTAGLKLAVPVYLTTSNQSVQPVAASASNGSFLFSTLGFSNGNGVTFGTSAGSVITASVNPGGGAGFTAGISGGNTSGDTGTISNRLVLAGGNNITVSGSTDAGGMSLTISGANAGGAQTGISGIIAGTQTQTVGTLSFANGNGISFGLSNSSVLTASYTVPTQSVQPVAVSGSNGSFNFSTLTMGALNGLSFYTSNGSMVGSYTVPTQTNQTGAVYASSQTFGQSSSSTYDVRSLSLVGSGGVSVGWSAGSLLVSGQTTTPQTVQTQSTVAVNGSTGAISLVTGSSLSSSQNGSTITFGLASNITTALQSAGAYLTTAAQSSVSNVSAIYAATNNTGGGTVTLSGGVSLSNANGLTFYTSAGNAIVASYSVPSVTQYFSNTATTFNGTNVSGSLTNNTNGLRIDLSVAAGGGGGTAATNYFTGNTTQSSSGTMPLSSQIYVGYGIVSVGQSNGSVLISAPNSVAATDMSIGISGGNTSGNTGTVANGQVVLAGGNNVTLSGSTVGSNMTITISGANVGGAQTGISGIIAGTQTQTSGTLSFANSNGISFGLSNSSVLTASYTVPTQSVQSLGIYASSQTFGQSSSSTHDARSLSVFGSGGISVGWSNGSLGISGQTTAAQTNQTLGIYASSQTTGQSSSSTHDARSLSLVGQGIVSAGWSAGSLIVSATQSNQAFSAAGGSSAFQTLGFSDNAHLSWTNTGGSVGAAPIRGSFFAASNTTQSSSGTINLSNLIFAGAGVASVGVSNGSVVVSVPAGGGGGFTGGISNLGNTAGTSGMVSNQIVFVGTNGVTISGSTNGNSATLSFSGGGGGGGGIALAASNTTFTSGTVVLSAAGGALTISSGAQSALFSVPATSSIVGANGLSVSTAGSTISIQNVPLSYFFLPGQDFIANLSAHANGTMSIQNRLLEDYRTATVFIMPVNISSVATAANNSSAAINFSVSVAVYTENANTLNSLFSTTFTNGATWTSNNTGNVTGAVFLTAPFNMGLPPGEYYFGVNMSTAATGNILTGAATTSLGNTISIMGLATANFAALSWHTLGAATNQSIGWEEQGLYTGTTAFTGGINLANISMAGTAGLRANFAAQFKA